VTSWPLLLLAVAAAVPEAAAQTPLPADCAPSQEPAALAAADAPGASLAARIDSVLPTAADERFLTIPWRENLMAARREAQAQRKPIFLWVMVGNPLGTT
jgi:hypothetical protein